MKDLKKEVIEILSEIIQENVGLEIPQDRRIKLDGILNKGQEVHLFELHKTFRYLDDNFNLKNLLSKSDFSNYKETYKGLSKGVLRSISNHARHCLSVIITARSKKSTRALSEMADFSPNFFNSFLKDERSITEPKLLQLLEWMLSSDNNTHTLVPEDLLELKSNFHHLNGSGESDEDRSIELRRYLNRKPREYSFIYYLGQLKKGIHPSEIRAFGFKYVRALEELKREGFLVNDEQSAMLQSSPIIDDFSKYQVVDHFKASCRELMTNDLYHRHDLTDETDFPVPVDRFRLERISIKSQIEIKELVNEFMKKTSEIMENDVIKENESSAIVYSGASVEILDFQKFLKKIT